MKQEIYIDGILMDTSDDTKVTLNYKSNIFKSLDSLVSNYTYTIRLPMTINNRRAIHSADAVGVISLFPYTEHQCQYYIDGIAVISNGVAHVKECSDSIEMMIYWGLFPALKTLQKSGMKLNELKSEDRVKFEFNNVPNTIDDFINNGYGYADYNPLAKEEAIKEWAGYSATISGNPTPVKMTTGKVFTGSYVGDIANLYQTTDSGYESAVVAVKAGWSAVIKGCASGGAYNTWALTDNDGKVLSMSSNIDWSKAERDMTAKGSDGGDRRYIVWTHEGGVKIRKVSIYTKRIEGVSSLKIYLNSMRYVNGKWSLVTKLIITAPNTDGWFDVQFNFDISTDEKLAISQKEGAIGYTTIARGYSDTEITVLSEDYTSAEDIYDPTTQHLVIIEYEPIIPSLYDHELLFPNGAAYLIVNAQLQYSSEERSVRIYGYKIYIQAVRATVQPSVTLGYINRLISQNTGVHINWTDAEDMNKYAVPLISRKSDEHTFDEQSLWLNFDNKSSLGTLTYTTLFLPSAMEDKRTYLKVTAPFAMTFSLMGVISKQVPTPSDDGRGGVTVSQDYVLMTIKHKDRNEEDSLYYIGVADEDEANAIVVVHRTNIEDGIWRRRIVGNGKIDLAIGDEISFSLNNNRDKNSKPTLTEFNCKADVANNGEVAYTGYYPIALNLPEISIIDYVKALNVITCSFPLQVRDGSSDIEMIGYDRIFANMNNAYDWSNRLIPTTNGHVRNAAYSLDGWCQHNRYKWKEDDEVAGQHMVDIALNNRTIDYEQDVWELPFAASEGNRIPIVTQSKVVSINQGGIGYAVQMATEYNECEPRLMCIEDKNGNASLVFNIDLERIYKERFERIRNTIEHPFIIKESFAMQAIDLLTFDESRPVFLRQYNQYFAVIEMQMDGDITTARLLQLN